MIPWHDEIQLDRQRKRESAAILNAVELDIRLAEHWARTIEEDFKVGRECSIIAEPSHKHVLDMAFKIAFQGLKFSQRFRANSKE